MTPRRPSHAALLLAVLGLGTAGTAVAYAALTGAGRPATDVGFPSGATLLTPLQRESVPVRVRTDGSTTVRVRVRSAAGKPLTESLQVRTRGRRTMTVRPPLTPLGRGMLGDCRSRGTVRVEAHSTDGRLLERTHARVRADEVRCAPLRWAPPALENPITVTVGQGYTHRQLQPDQDYVVKLPSERKVGGLTVRGGRNVVVIGGHVSIPSDAVNEQRRAIHVASATGTVHLEGILIDDAAGGEGDAISIDARQAVVQVQNVRVDGVRGRYRGLHGDVIQPWGGVRALRVDRLTASSTYQGLYLPVDLGPIGGVDLRSVDLTALPGLERGGGHMLWMTSASSCDATPTTLSNVYIRPRMGRTLGSTVWPQSQGHGGICRAKVAGRTASWPASAIKGRVHEGLPPGGHFVPWGIAGGSYGSPGYQR